MPVARRAIADLAVIHWIPTPSHHKTQPDAHTLHVTVKPAAILTFGQGAAPDQPGLNIDEGWQRAAGWHFPRA